MSTFEFDDQTHIARLVGTLHSPGATPGDVLTVNADKSVSPAPGGGSQPFTPTDLTGLALWLDASQIIGLSDGAKVTSWTDLASGYVFTQAVADSQPVYKTAIQNGLAVVRFVNLASGAPADQWLDTADAAAILRAKSGVTVATAFRSADAASWAAFWVKTVATDPVCAFLAGIGDLTIGNVNRSVQSNSAPQVDGFATYFGRGSFDGAFATVAAGSTGSGVSADQHSVVGVFDDVAASLVRVGSNPATDDGLHGDLGEMLVYDRALNAAELRQMLEYLSAKWDTL